MAETPLPSRCSTLSGCDDGVAVAAALAFDGVGVEPVVFVVGAWLVAHDGGYCAAVHA